MVREVPVQTVRDHQLQGRVAEELESLVRTQRQMREADRTIRERAR